MDKTSKILKSLEKMAEKEFVPSIGPIKGKIIKDTIKKYSPKDILEIGTLYGYSAILMASTLSRSDGKVVMFLDAAKGEYLEYLKSAERYCLEKGAVIIADNVKVSKDEMQDYLEYVRNSGVYTSRTIETTLEFTPNIKDALEISIKNIF